MVDLNRIGTDVSTIGSVLAGVSNVTSGAPGGSIATDEQGNFSLDALSKTLAKIGSGLSEFGHETSPQTGGPAPAGPSTSPGAGSSLPDWLPWAAAGVGVLILVVILARS